MFRLDDQNVYRAESLEQFPWLEHGFGTRLSNGWPDGSRLVTAKQIHSNDVIVVPNGAPAGLDARIGRGDALISVDPEPMVGIRTADCLPIIVVSPTTSGFGAIHAGWRGTVLNISAQAIRAMVGQFGTSPEDIWAAIGPGIGPCCFEVGEDVAAQFQGIFPERVDLHHRTTIDLAEANRRQLEAAGVPTNQIEVSGLCTVCRTAEFHSFRRDREKAGRMLSVVGHRYTKGAGRNPRPL